MACTDVCAVVLNDLLYDCQLKAVGGIRQTLKIINRCDIDLANWTVSRTMDGTACTHTVAYSGLDPININAKTVQGIPGKRLLRAAFSSSDTDFGTYYTHNVDLFAQGLTRDMLCNIKALGEGADLIAIVEDNFKGEDNQDAFKVYGWDTGLKILDFTYDSNENNGNTILPLGSRDPDLEPFPPMVLFMTDYETTAAFFNGL